MKLYVNGQEKASWTVNKTSYANYTSSTVPLHVNDQIDVVFTNWDSGRSLYVDYVTISGVTTQAEGPTLFDPGQGAEAFDGLGIIPGQEQYPSSGALRFVRGSTAQAYGYDQNGNMTYKLLVGQATLYQYDTENRMTQVR